MKLFFSLLIFSVTCFSQLPNPDIGQGNIGKTICNPRWHTASIRPPSSYTDALKLKQMKELGLKGKPKDYEEDHIISLEIGGHPNDPRNLTPQAYLPKPGAREKDRVENLLHKEVCAGTVTLARAQEIVSKEWLGCYAKIQVKVSCK